jgi:hypothetical protein
MLLRMRDRKLRRGGGLSTATKRWRPGGARGSRGARAGGHQGRGIGPGEEGGDAWACVAAGGGARGPVPTVCSGGRSRAEGEAAVTEEEEAGNVRRTGL